MSDVVQAARRPVSRLVRVVTRLGAVSPAVALWLEVTQAARAREGEGLSDLADKFTHLSQRESIGGFQVAR